MVSDIVRAGAPQVLRSASQHDRRAVNVRPTRKGPEDRARPVPPSRRRQTGCAPAARPYGYSSRNQAAIAASVPSTHTRLRRLSYCSCPFDAALLYPDGHRVYAEAVAKRVAFHCPPHRAHSQSVPLRRTSCVTAASRRRHEQPDLSRGLLMRAGRCYGITREGQDSGKRCPPNVTPVWSSRCSLMDISDPAVAAV